jgi:hypothetical protein
MISDASEFYNLSINTNFTIITDTLYEDLYTFLHMVMTGWGIPIQQHNQMGEYPVMTSSPSQQVPDTPPMQRQRQSQRVKITFWQMYRYHHAMCTFYNSSVNHGDDRQKFLNHAHSSEHW